MRRLEALYELPSRDRIVAMEGLRGMAIALVFCVHFHSLFKVFAPPTSLVYAISNMCSHVGNAGVDLFFVISGYLIYGAVIRKQVVWTSFMRRRLQRIYPTFLAVFALYLALCLLHFGENKLPHDIRQAIPYVLANLALLPGIFPIKPIITVSWTLSYELFFYLSIPLVVSALHLRQHTPTRRVQLFAGLAVVLMAGILSGIVDHDQMLMFIAGVLVYEAGQCKQLTGRMKVRGEWLAALLVIVGLTVVGLLPVYGKDILLWPARHISLWGLRTPVLFACFGFFALYCFHFNGRLSRVFSWTPLRWVGNMSYSFYLVHGITLHLVASIATRVLPRTLVSPVLFCTLIPVAVVVCVVTSTALFVGIEKPFSLTRRAPVTARPTPLESGLSISEAAVRSPADA